MYSQTRLFQNSGFNEHFLVVMRKRYYRLVPYIISGYEVTTDHMMCLTTKATHTHTHTYTHTHTHIFVHSVSEMKRSRELNKNIQS